MPKTLTYYPCGRHSQGRRLWEQTGSLKISSRNKMTLCARASVRSCLGRRKGHNTCPPPVKVTNVKFLLYFQLFFSPLRTEDVAMPSSSYSIPAWICWRNVWCTLTSSCYLCPAVVTFSSCCKPFSLVPSLSARCDVQVRPPAIQLHSMKSPHSQSRSALICRHPKVQYISYNGPSLDTVEWVN